MQKFISINTKLRQSETPEYSEHQAKKIMVSFSLDCERDPSDSIFAFT